MSALPVGIESNTKLISVLDVKTQANLSQFFYNLSPEMLCPAANDIEMADLNTLCSEYLTETCLYQAEGFCAVEAVIEDGDN